MFKRQNKHGITAAPAAAYRRIMAGRIVARNPLILHRWIAEQAHGIKQRRLH